MNNCYSRLVTALSAAVFSTTMASLTDSSGAAQPVTTAPQLSKSGTHRLIFVGTGQLLGKTDVTTTQTQSMYGLVDNLSSNPTISNVRSTLQQQIVSGTMISKTAVNFDTTL